jgi:membrane associated rhomboid family serine protease
MPVYGLTVVWALVGVIVANMGDNTLIAGAAASGGVIMLAALAWTWRKA